MMDNVGLVGNDGLVTQQPKTYAGYSMLTQPSEPDTFSIIGPDSQILQMVLQPGSHVMTEPGTLVHMADATTADLHWNSCEKACTRCLVGEHCCLVSYTNSGGTVGFVGLTPSYPAKVIPIPMDQYKTIYAKSGSYMTSSASPPIEIDIHCIKSLRLCCCAGQSCCMQKLSGSQWLFLNAGGTVLERELGPNEMVVIDSKSLVAFTEDCKMNIRPVGSCFTMCCAGQGCYNTTVKGPGKVWVESMGFEKMKRALQVVVQKKNNGNGGSGDVVL